MIRVLLSLALLHLAYTQCCSNSPSNYCPTSEAIPDTEYTTCATWGTGHIHTFDGLSYDFHEYGDFWLIGPRAGSNPAFTAQVRMLDCPQLTQAAPLSQGTTISATCNRAYVFKIGTIANVGRLQLMHNTNAKTLEVYYDGVLRSYTATQPITITVSGGGSFVVAYLPITYVNPYSASHRNSTYLPDADFSVVVNATTAAGTLFFTQVLFYSNGLSTAKILAPPSAPLRNNVAGLCGAWDGCRANDLLLRRPNGAYPLTAELEAAVAPYLATVTASVTAGSLGTDSQFINTTKNPQKWAPMMGSRWRVSPAESYFISTNLQYNIRDVTTKYIPTQPCSPSDFPNGAPTFLLDQCGDDRQAIDDMDGWDKQPAYDLLLFYCRDFCYLGTSHLPFQHRDFQPYHCDGYCTYEGYNSQDGYIKDPTGNPPADAYSWNTPRALMTPTLGTAGTYTFAYTTQDFCEERQGIFTRNIQCTKSWSLPQPTARAVERTKLYGYPIVRVDGTFPKGIVHVAWNFVSFPLTPLGVNVFGATMYFRPTAAGIYNLSYSIYDGCQIIRQFIEVDVRCSYCALPARIQVLPVKDYLWGLDFTNPATPPTTQSGVYPSKTALAVIQNPDYPYLPQVTYEWFAEDIAQQDKVGLWFSGTTATKTYQVARWKSPQAKQMAAATGLGQVQINETRGMPTWTAPVQSGPVTQNPLTATRLRGPLGTQFGVFPPQREYTYTRDATRYAYTWSNSLVEPFQQFFQQPATFSSVCSIQLNNANTDSVGLSVTQTQSVGAQRELFLKGSNCVGLYGLRLAAVEAGCATSSEVQAFDVDCGPRPIVNLKCTSLSVFTYAAPSRSFASVTVDASRSADSYSRQLRYLYTVISAPQGSVRLGNIPCGVAPEGCTVNTVSFTPDLPGDYVVQVEVSNQCNYDSDTITFTAYCPSPSSTLHAVVTANPYVIPYLGTAMSTQLDASGSYSDVIGAILSYSWTISSAPVPPDQLAVRASFGGFPVAATATTSLNLAYDGTYTVQVVVDQGCAQSATVQQDIQVLCDANLQARITTTDPLTVTLDQSTNSFPNQALRGDTSLFGFTNYPPQTYTVTNGNYFWYVNGSSVGNGAVFNFRANNPGIYFVELVISDGCRFSRTNITLSAECGSLSAVITSPTIANNSRVDSATPITLDGSGNPNVLVFSWSVLAAPVGSNAALSNTATSSVQITPLRAGNYVVRLTISIGCASGFRDFMFSVGCPSLLTAVASPSVTTVYWGANGFPVIELHGNNSLRDTQAIISTWYVEGPSLSVFDPGPITTVSAPQTNFLSSVQTEVDGIIYTTVYYQTVTQYNNFTYQYVLPANTLNPALRFATCFFPDIEGVYKVKLELVDSCQTSSSEVVLNARCQAPPTIVFNAHEEGVWSNTSNYLQLLSQVDGLNATYRVKLARYDVRRIVLNASLSTSQSGHKLSYYWSWRSPDPRATLNAQVDIDSPYASAAELVLPKVGAYFLLLTVHDGCAVSFFNVTLIADCESQVKPLDLQDGATIVTDGSRYSTILLQNWARESDGRDQLQCARFVEWQFQDYSPSTSAVFRAQAVHSGGASMEPFRWLVLAVMIVCIGAAML